jgi:hypothetical protein
VPAAPERERDLQFCMKLSSKSARQQLERVQIAAAAISMLQ